VALITAIVPTITGREHWLEKCVKAYERTTPSLQLIIVHGKDSCGEAWQEGSLEAKGDYIHFGADDVEVHQGWWEAAAAVCDGGNVPAPLVFNTDGSVQSCGGSWECMEPDGAVTEFTRGPFMSLAQWSVIGPMEALHYYSDNWFTYRARLAGFEPVVCHGYAMTHHLAPEGRLHNRLGSDGAEYNRLVEGGSI